MLGLLAGAHKKSEIVAYLSNSIKSLKPIGFRLFLVMSVMVVVLMVVAVLMTVAVARVRVAVAVVMMAAGVRVLGSAAGCFCAVFILPL